MNQALGFVLCLTPERHDLFQEIGLHEGFAEPVAEFSHSRNIPLVCFVIDSEQYVTHIATAKRGRLAGTGLRRLNIQNTFPLKEAVSSNAIVHESPKRNQSKLKQRLSSGGLLPPKTFEALIQSLSSLAPETAAVLSKYSEARLIRIKGLSNEVQQSLAEQKEAIATALEIAGIERDELSGWDFSNDQPVTSFLDGMQQVRLREDSMIVNDLHVFPGHEIVKETVYNAVTFENAVSKLTVVLANKLPLEEQTGTDLIYYNETFKCFLMVQYKAMEKERSEAVFRFPSTQLDKEISRMDVILSEIGNCPKNSEADGFRFSENPFFLKICPRIVFEPDSVALVKGMYVPLDYWKLISEHPTLVGPKGGKLLSYRNVRRYLDNSAFITIAAGGWVGTTISQSKVLEAAIKSTIESGRAAVIAVNESKDSRHRNESAFWADSSDEVENQLLDIELE